MGYTQIYYLAASLSAYIKYLYTKKIDIGFYWIIYRILQYCNRFKTRYFCPHCHKGSDFMR